MSSVNILGVKLRYVKLFDIIMPEDHNNKREALRRIADKIVEIKSSVEEILAKIKELSS